MTLNEIIHYKNNQVYFLLHSYMKEKSEILCYEVASFIGFDMGVHMVRNDIYNEVIIEALVNYISVLLNNGSHKHATKMIQMFDKLSYGKKIPGILIYQRLIDEAELKTRLGDYDSAIVVNKRAEEYADNHFFRYKLFLQRGSIENLLNNRFDFGVNSISEALYEAEQCNERCVADVYEKLTIMCSVSYVSLGISFLMKADIIYQKLQDYPKLNISRLTRIISYYILSNKYADKAEIFIGEAKKLLDGINRGSLTIEQNKIYYDYAFALIYKDVELLKSCCKYYERIGALREVCRMCDAILEISINQNIYDGLQPYIDKYLEAAIKSERHDLSTVLENINEAKRIINEKLLAKEA